MKVAINTRLLIKNRLDGIGWFTFETVKRITLGHPEHEFYFIFDRPFDKDFIFSKNITPVVLPPPARHPVLWFIWLEFAVSRFLKKKGIDVFVSPDGFLPLSSSVPSVSVVHDINFHHRPEDLPFISEKYYNYFFPRFVRKATRIGTVSEYSANDISKSYGVNLNKIDIFHNGVNAAFAPLNYEEINRVRKNLTRGKPYFLFIGTLHPRKNVANLLYAYDEFRKNGKEEVLMVIVGEKMFLTKDIENALDKMEYSEDVIFAGRLNAKELHKVLGASLALTFVPRFEGFGIPVVEAMKCGVPVITSDVTSLPEVGGEAVLYSSPDDVKAVALNMKQIAEDEELRTELVKKGIERARLFNWDETADKLWQTIVKTINES